MKPERTYYKWFTYPEVQPDNGDLIVTSFRLYAKTRVYHAPHFHPEPFFLQDGDLWMRIEKPQES